MSGSSYATTASHRLLLAAAILALMTTALLLLVVSRLSQTRKEILQVRATCHCCVEDPP